MVTHEEIIKQMHDEIHRLINQYHRNTYGVTHDYERQPIKMNTWCAFCSKDSDLLIKP